jgi:hypothetical protein
MKKIAFIIYVLVFFPVCVFSQTTLILQPDSSTGKDALLHNLSSASNTNFGTDTQLLLKPGHLTELSLYFAV